MRVFTRTSNPSQTTCGTTERTRNLFLSIAEVSFKFPCLTCEVTPSILPESQAFTGLHSTSPGWYTSAFRAEAARSFRTHYAPDCSIHRSQGIFQILRLRIVTRTSERSLTTNRFSVPLRIEFLNIVISKNNSEQVGVVLDRIMGSSDPELIVDQVGNLSTSKETVLFLGLFVPPD